MFDLMGIRTGLVGVIGLTSAGGEVGGLSKNESRVCLVGVRAFTAILAAVVAVYGGSLCGKRNDSKASFLQAEAVEVVGDSGGDESDEVVEEDWAARFWFCLETRKDLGDIILTKPI